MIKRIFLLAASSGDLNDFLLPQYADENPEICRVSNVRLDGRIDKLGGSYELHQRGNQYWHTDSSYKNVPSKASVLRAITVPESGGATQFADMRAAYDALDIEYRTVLENKVVVHDYIYSQGLIGGLEQLTDQELLALPPVEHRLIQTHPGSGRKSLFVGRHASHIAGEDLEESRAELVKITEDACQPPRIFSHKWREGDLVIWDNRCVLHRGRPWRSGSTSYYVFVRPLLETGIVTSGQWIEVVSSQKTQLKVVKTISSRLMIGNSMVRSLTK